MAELLEGGGHPADATDDGELQKLISRIDLGRIVRIL